MQSLASILRAAICLFACDSGSEARGPDDGRSAPTYRPVTNVKQTMEWILDPAEAGNLLMMPRRAAGPDWIAYAEALVAAGSEIYQACRSCHAQFMVPLEEARNAP